MGSRNGVLHYILQMSLTDIPDSIGPCTLSGEHHILADTSVHDFDFRHTVLFFINIHNAGIGIFLCYKIFDGSGNIRREIIFGRTAVVRIGHFLHQNAVLRIIEVHFLITFLHFDDVDNSHFLTFQLVYIFHLPYIIIGTTLVRASHRSGKVCITEVGFGHLPYTVFGEPGLLFEIVLMEISHIICTFCFPFYTLGIGMLLGQRITQFRGHGDSVVVVIITALQGKGKHA